MDFRYDKRAKELNSMRKLVIGILAHVDAGKTTLSEGMLYLGGRIRKLGRVDKQDAFLDNYQLERERGITIFSKQAIIEYDDIRLTLLDTPGHVDFSTEMERTLQVLDYAILVISGADGVQGHTKTLWKLLNLYKIPVFLFINKMDQSGTDKLKLLRQLKSELNGGCIEFTTCNSRDFLEELALCDEKLMEVYLEKGNLSTSEIIKAVKRRQVFPCFFGSALRLDGVKELMQGICKYTEEPLYNDSFGARVFKIARDDQGNRLTYMKVTGGSLKVKDSIVKDGCEEKVNQIRIYSGQKFETIDEAEAGTVCAVTGLSLTKSGEGLGEEQSLSGPVLEPVLSYQIILPEGCDPRTMLPKLRQIEEEDPELHIVWNEKLQEIQAQIMGEVQIEILQRLIKDRFGVDVSFGEGSILYKETIADTVEGVGHFEPLRHYAEVHLLLEPLERGSGIRYDINCSDDILSKNWKNLAIAMLKQKIHKGVLTDSDITDIKVTLVSGKAHLKHTEGGDFREAACRALRQGLKEASSILLEPYYSFRLELPKSMVGRAMNDIDNMGGTYTLEHTDGETALITGIAPVITMRNYQTEVTAYTKGEGRLFCSLKGYEPCHNPQEVIASFNYDSERDLANPTGSVFCGNGSSYLVSWDHVKEHMHIEPYLRKEKETVQDMPPDKPLSFSDSWIDPEEVDRILAKSNYNNQGRKSIWTKRRTNEEADYKIRNSSYMNNDNKREYMLVDGYNVIYAWPELNELAQSSMEGARVKLMDCLSKYRGICKYDIIIVFDAYMVQGHKEEVIDYHNIHVVYTKEAQTADQYIEKFAHDNSRKYHITVATSDGLQQVIIRGAGCSLISSRELRTIVYKANEVVMKEFLDSQAADRNTIRDSISNETKHEVEALLKNNEL